MKRGTRTAGSSLERLFPGDGDMARRMRAQDWSATPLGPTDRWPTSLRTIVGVMLGNGHPMAVWWGGQCLHLYNDAYSPILGEKHPASLGRSGAAVWAESWNIIGPMAQGVLDGGPATWNEHFLFPVNRRGFLEETYFTFSYSPIPDDVGAVGGVLVTTKETTVEVQDGRQIRTLRDLNLIAAVSKTVDEALRHAAHVLSTNDADFPFALLYAVDEDGARARLVGTAGMDGHDGSGAPAEIALDDGAGGAAWPLQEASRTPEPLVVADLRARVGAMPGGRWTEAPAKAVVLCLTRPGLARPYGFLVSGANPRRLLDDRYLDFFRLTAKSISAAIANARAYEEERRRAEALDELDRAKTAFFSNVSHEFRTPLTLLLGPLEDALSSGDDALGPRNHERLDLAHRNGLRLLKLVNTLLDFSRIEAGRVDASYEETDICSLTEELASVFRSAIERAGLSLRVSCRRPDGPVFLDREMWEKVVLNLLSNAFKFTLSGEISVGVETRGATVVTTVRDTGTGIPPEEVPHLFERFHRVRGTRGRTHEGTGIGLALVQELVRLHGGTVAVESRLGQGTTFTVAIPTGAAHLPKDRLGGPRTRASTALGAAPYVEEALRWLPEGAREPEPEALGAAAGAVRTVGARVLVADDNQDLRDYLRRLLSIHWRVETASDGEEALAAIRRGRPDLVLSDVMMPKMDGFALLKAVRQDPATRTLPFLLLSARAGEEARVDGLRASADDYLVKPFSARELIARVNTHLELARVRREAQAQLAASERKYRTLFETIDEGFCIIEKVDAPPGSALDFRYVDANPAFAVHTGAHDVVGKTVREAFPDEPDAGVLARYDAVLRTGKAVRFEHELTGSGRVLELSAFRVDDGTGRRLAVLFKDISERRRAENEREALLAIAEHARAEAELQKTHLASLFTQAPAPICVLRGADDVVELANPAACAMWGRTADAVVGRPLLDAMPELVGQVWKGLLDGVRTTGTTHVGKETPAVFTRADGRSETVLLNFVYTPLRSVTGAVEGVLVIAFDVTDEVRAREKMNELRAEAERANRVKDEFLAMLSHELRSPMNAMLGWLRVLKSAGTREPALVGRAVETLERNIWMQAQVINDLLDVSRILSGKLQLDHERLDFSAVVHASVESLRPAAEAKQVTLRLHMHVDDDDVAVVGDEARLQQVVANLVGNAIKFTDPGGSVVVSVARRDATVSLAVEDTGQGIAPAFLPHLFERFRQADSSAARRHGGLGLGLSIVQHIVAMHGGGIEAESAGLGHGARFTVRLPIAEPRQRLAFRSPPSEPVRAAERLALDVLVVEDDHDSRDALALALGELGTQVRAVATVRQALDAYSARPPDVLISDIAMPGEDGYALIRAIRELEEGRSHRTLAIAMTGFAGRQDHEMALRAGFDAHVAKPIEPDALFDRLRALAASRGPGGAATGASRRAAPPRP